MKITVIIPVWNTKVLILRQCIENVIRQTIDLEILCIDDGSDQAYYDEIAAYINSVHGKIRLISNVHNGVAYSRNFAIKEARGEYIAFLDADDYYPSNDVLAALYEAAKTKNVDIVGGSFSDLTGDIVNYDYGDKLAGYTFKENSWIDYKDYQFDYGFHRFIYRRKFLIKNNLFFPHLTRFQDPPFLVQALHKAGKFYAIDKVVYCYRNSAIGVNWTEEKVADCIKGVIWNMRFALNNNYSRLYELSISRLLWHLYDYLKLDESKESLAIRTAMSKMIDTLVEGYEYNELDYVEKTRLKELEAIYRKNLLTIVVPVYNVENYLRQCLDSLVNQTKKCFDVIIVDDGSTDGSSDICKSYQLKYPGLIRYIHQTNKGLGAARNTGLQEVTTKYVAFLDSDDWVNIHYVERLLRFIQSNSSVPDMILTLPTCYNDSSKQMEDWMDKWLFEQISNKYPKTCTSTKLCPELYWLEVNANRKVYRKDFLDRLNFEFPVGIKWEDITPHIQLMHEASSIALFGDDGFVYRTNTLNQITAGTGNGRVDFIKVLADSLLVLQSKSYAEIELVHIIHLLCRYIEWMIDMTNIDYIYALLQGFHEELQKADSSLFEVYYNCNWIENEIHNKYCGLLKCLISDGYEVLSDYVERSNQYRYWVLNNGKKKNIIVSGIQCVKDSGFKYTFRLLLKKLLYQGF